MEQQTVYSVSLSCQINLKNTATARHVLTRAGGILLCIDICKRKYKLQEKLNNLT